MDSWGGYRDNALHCPRMSEDAAISAWRTKGESLRKLAAKREDEAYAHLADLKLCLLGVE